MIKALKSNRKKSPLEKLQSTSAPKKGMLMAMKKGPAAPSATMGKKKDGAFVASKLSKSKKPLSQVKAPHRSKRQTPRYS